MTGHFAAGPATTPLGRRLRSVLSDQSGVALFMVIWILALLMVIVGQFSYGMRAEVNSTRQYKEAATAHYIAEAGISRGIVEILKQQAPQTEEEVPLPPEGSDADWRVNVPLPAVDFGEGRYRVYIDNESGRVNLNTAERGMLQMLVDSLQLSASERDTIVDAILDWRDADDLHRLNGAENDYYQSLAEPYRCKNGPFDSVSELLLVRGVTPEVYHGGLEEMVTVIVDEALQAEQSDPASRSIQVGPRLARRHADRAGRAAASGAVNINAARQRMLAALPRMTDGAVQDILTFRAQADFRSLDEVAGIVGTDIFEAIAPFITLQMSPYYIIHTEGRVTGSRVRQLLSVRVKIDPAGEKKFVVLARRLN